MSASFLLDTCVIINALKGATPAINNRLAGLAPNRLVLSSIVAGELEAGAAKSNHPAKARLAYGEFTRDFDHAVFDFEDAVAFGRIRGALERKGKPIGPIDCLLAAQALARDLVLVTDNLREFKRVSGLRCESWA